MDQMRLTGNNEDITNFYERIAEDSKQSLIQLVSEAGHGKALALDTPIPTKQGWRTMGEICVGDIVFDETGKTCKVITTSQVMHNHDVYEMEFDDGSIIKSDSEHLWITSTRNSRLAEWRRKKTGSKKGQSLYSVKTTEEIVKTLRVHTKKATNHAIPVSLPLQLEKIELPIPPYVLGAWLGDGTSENGAITVVDKEIIEQIEKNGFKLKQWNTKKGVKPHNIIGLYKKLRENNLLKNKHIPQKYLRANMEQRLELLRGLLDTDGTSTKDHDVSYCTTREELAHDFSELLHSLGIKHRFVVHDAKLYGRVISKRYRFRFSINEKLFYIKRKQERINSYVRSTRGVRYIVNARKIPSEPVRCIGVDSPNHLFLAGREMIPTHNTSSLRTIIQHVKETNPEIVFKIFDVSQAWFHCAPAQHRQLVTREKLARNQVANILDCVYEIGSLSKDEKRAFVGTILKQDWDIRYQAKLNRELHTYPNICYVFEESNIYFGSYSFRRNDEYSPVFDDYVSVGRNYKMRGFLVATVEEGEMAPSLRRRSRKIYGNVISTADLSAAKKRGVTVDLTKIPKYTFAYKELVEKIPDLVTTTPEDYEYTPEASAVVENDWVTLLKYVAPWLVVFILFVSYFN